MLDNSTVRKIESYRYYLRFERNLAESTQKKYLPIVTAWLASNLSAKEFMENQDNYNSKLDALKSWNRFSDLEDNVNDLWIENAFYHPRPERLPVTLSNYEVSRIFRACQTDQEKCIIELLYSCGLRISELHNLTIDQVHDYYLKITGKGNKERLVPIHQKARSLLLSLKTEGSRFFPMHLHTLRKTIKRLVIMSGTRKKVTPHTFRHTYATHLYDNGARLCDVQAMLGHAHIKTTEIYTRLSIGHLRQAIEKHPARKFKRVKMLKVPQDKRQSLIN